MTLGRVITILILCFVFCKAGVIVIALAGLLKDNIETRKSAIQNGAENPPSYIPMAIFCVVFALIEVFQVIITFQAVTKTFL